MNTDKVMCIHTIIALESDSQVYGNVVMFPRLDAGIVTVSQTQIPAAVPVKRGPKDHIDIDTRILVSDSKAQESADSGDHWLQDPDAYLAVWAPTAAKPNRRRLPPDTPPQPTGVRLKSHLAACIELVHTSHPLMS